MKRLKDGAIPKGRYVYAWKVRGRVVYVGLGSGRAVWKFLNPGAALRVGMYSDIAKLLQTTPESDRSAWLLGEGLTPRQAKELKVATVGAAHTRDGTVLRNRQRLPVVKQTTRLCKLTCPGCGVIVRASRAAYEKATLGCFSCDRPLRVVEKPKVQVALNYVGLPPSKCKQRIEMAP